MNKKVVILSFSGRKAGNCAAISDFIERFYMRTNVLSFIVDNKSFPACGGCDYECLKQGVRCPVLTEDQRKIMEAITKSDLVYFIVPNYCGYPCANYFAFNERSVGYFNMDRALMEKYMAVKKRFIVVSNSEEIIAAEAGEGCLSVNREVDGHVPRFARVTVEGYDENGNKIRVRAREDLSIAFQHEIDHLNGILFYDRINKHKPFYGEDEIRLI